MSGATVEPGWAETSIRWLRSNYPAYAPATSRKPASDVLTICLKRMQYLRHGMATFTDAKWAQHLANESETWGSRDHSRMVAFLKAGGHEALVRVAKEKAAVEPLSVVDPTTGEVERVTLDFDDVEEEIARERAPRSQLSPQHELEEIVAEEVLKADPRLGAW